MNKAIVLSLAALMTLATGSMTAYASTAPTPQWGYAYDGGSYESLESVVQTPDGGYASVGSLYLMKMDANGTVQWAVKSAAYLNGVRNLPGGGYVVTGSMGVPGTNGSKGYLAKYDANGSLVWEQQYVKGTSNFFETVQLTKEGGFILAGSTSLPTSTGSNAEVWLIKTDANGNKLWEQTYGSSLKSDYAGDSDNSVQQTSDGGYIVAGSTIASGVSDVYLFKTDANGTLKWSKSYGGTGIDFGYSVQQSTDGGYIIAGMYSYSTDNDAYLIKTDSLGNSQWQRTYGGTQYDAGRTVYQTSDGGYVMSGMYQFSSTDYDFYIVKTTSTGLIDWQNAYGGALWEDSTTLSPTNDGGYVLGGFTESFALSGRDFYLLKLGYGTALSPNGSDSESKLQAKSIPAVKGNKALSAPFAK